MTEETVVVDTAGEHTLAGDAFLVDGTLRVAGAKWTATAICALVTQLAVSVAAACDRHTDALRLGRSGESGSTEADGFVIFRPALGVHATFAVNRARVDTLAADASFAILAFAAGLTGRFANTAVTECVGWTVRLGSTTDRCTNASDSLIGRIALVTFATDAGGFVICRKTVGIGSARESGANVLTFRLASFAATDGRWRTILILATLDRLLTPFFVRFSNGSGRAKTFIRASGVFASSSGSTRFLQAVINGCTTGQSVACVARLAFANRLVSLRETKCILA